MVLSLRPPLHVVRVSFTPLRPKGLPIVKLYAGLENIILGRCPVAAPHLATACSCLPMCPAIDLRINICIAVDQATRSIRPISANMCTTIEGFSHNSAGILCEKKKNLDLFKCHLEMIR